MSGSPSTILQRVRNSPAVAKIKNIKAAGQERVQQMSKLSRECYLRWQRIATRRSLNLSGEVSRIINQMTGYEQCEKLRGAVTKADSRFQALKDDLRKSRAAFDAAIDDRCHCQKELNSLLQRKQTWKDEDLLRFTELYRSEMRLEQSEAEARSTNQQLEEAADEAHQKLMDAVRERYQEEQLWSDKIRRLSTFGTFSLMGLNLVLFLFIQLVLEPRKRRKLLGNFDDIVDKRFIGFREDIHAALASAAAMPTRPPSPAAAAANSRSASMITLDRSAALQATALGAGVVILLSFAKFIVSDR